MVSQDQDAVEPSSGDGSPEPPSALAPLWRNRDYMSWWTSETVSAVGTSMSTIAFPLVVLYTSGSVVHAGLIAAAQMLGLLLTTLWGGVLADRVSRKALMVGGPLAQAVAMAVAAVAVHGHHTAVPLLAAIALAGGLSAGVAKGATTPALRRIVPKEQVGQATGQEMGRDMAAELIGAPLGGALFSVARWFPFAVDSVSFVFASLGAALIRRPLGPDRAVKGAAAGERPGVLDDIKAGLRFVRQQPFLRFTVVWASLLNVLAQAFVLLFIALVRHRGGGPTAVGVVNSTALIGGVAGAVLAPVLLAKARATTVLRAGIWGFAASFALVAVVPRWWEIGLVLAVAMLAMVPLNVVIESYVVRLVPDALSGRVAAVNRFGAQALAWTGPLLTGGLVDAFGAPGASLVLGALTIPLALAVHLTGSLAVLDRPVDQAEELRAPEGQLAGADQR